VGALSGGLLSGDLEGRRAQGMDITPWEDPFTRNSE